MLLHDCSISLLIICFLSVCVCVASFCRCMSISGSAAVLTQNSTRIFVHNMHIFVHNMHIFVKNLASLSCTAKSCINDQPWFIMYHADLLVMNHNVACFLGLVGIVHVEAMANEKRASSARASAATAVVSAAAGAGVTADAAGAAAIVARYLWLCRL